MLREITAVRQDTPSLYRRWFSDTDMDLFIWFNKQVPTKFQLSYGKDSTEHTITWDREHGFRHDRVDDGENRVGKYKMAPILFDESSPNISELARNFLLASENIEPTLADFVYARLLEYPRFRPGRPDQGTISIDE